MTTLVALATPPSHCDSASSLEGSERDISRAPSAAMARILDTTSRSSVLLPPRLETFTPLQLTRRWRTVELLRCLSRPPTATSTAGSNRVSSRCSYKKPTTLETRTPIIGDGSFKTPSGSDSNTGNRFTKAGSRPGLPLLIHTPTTLGTHT
ncbi:uncharacterized protein J3D65DRAFT_225783 [Phyllosticta citribraziliensis]|uniref:Uncharacterized protein n=1 Tax=Phyllosticta citribraziliensis TaxID=989973 RepID=A0ABR1M525_9PEZI